MGLYDPSAERLSATAAKFGQPPAFTEAEHFFALEMDAVVIASPSWAHKQNVLVAARHGLHVLCEKPIAMDDADGAEMIEVMKNAGKMFFVGFVYRFSPVAQQIKRWVDEKVAGDIRSLRLIYIWDLHGQWEQTSAGEWIESPRWTGRMLEGGPLVDCGVHQIDLARWWLGEEVIRSHADAAWVSEYEAPDHLYLHMDHEKGVHTMIETSFTFGHTSREPRSEFSYDLIGTGGTLRYDRDGYILEARNGEGVIRMPGASEKNFLGLYQAFAEALETGDATGMPSAEDGLIATKIAREATNRAIQQRVHPKEKL